MDLYISIYTIQIGMEKTIFPDDNEEMYRYNSMGYIRKL